MPEEEGRRAINTRCMVGGNGVESTYYTREGGTYGIKLLGD